jgi:hypothetical protein
LKFQASESLIGVNGTFCLVEKKKEEREGRRRSFSFGWIRCR